MWAATYATIWIALILFVGAEMGRAASRAWARPLSALGLALALVHTALAFEVFHDWSHQAAVAHTARQTREVFGLAFGAGIVANYLFFAAWLVDLVLWRPAATPSHGVWLLRAFYLLIIVNGAVVFASGWRRIVGAILIASLVRIWRPAGHR